MNGLLALVLLAASPVEGLPVVETVDLLEVHSLYDDSGKYVWTQIIFYEWDQEDARYNVKGWRMVKSHDQWPTRNYAGGGYSVTWQDGDVMRRVLAHAMRTTYLQYDPELVEREFLPKDLRRDLVPVPSRFKGKSQPFVIEIPAGQ